MKLKLNYKKKKLQKHMEAKQCVTVNGSLKKLNKYLKTNKNENMAIQKSMGNRKSSSKRNVFSHTSIAHEIRKI